MIWALCITGAYLVGSIPFGVLIARARGIDIRAHGSGNIGATNVMRVLGRPFGILCFILDAAKGAGPVLAVGAMMGTLGRVAVGDGADALAPREQALWIGVALAAVVGHMFSVFLRFRGGKGVATGFGAVAAIWPLLTLPCLVGIGVWLLSVRLTRYVSVASMLAAMSLPVSFAVIAMARGATGRELLAQGWPPLVLSGALAALVVWRHRTNLARLRRGEEPRIGRRS